MSYTKKQIWAKTLNQGLASANRQNPFWSKSEAMQSINQLRAITRTAT
jgi:hypothetical protein